MSENTAYPKDTVGRELSKNIPTAKTTDTVDHAITQVTRQAHQFSTINYIYVLDSTNKLAGVISIKNLLAAARDKLSTQLSELMDKTVVSVRPHTPQEKAAHKALKYNIKAIPVVDKDQNLLGVVDSDKILSIMHEKTSEDFLKLSGITSTSEKFDDVITLSAFKAIKHRLPWLIVGLLGGLAIAQFISLFEDTLRQSVIISAYIPMMVYMSNAVGQQVMAFLVRDSATHEKIDYLKYFAKQAVIVIVIAALISSILFISSYAIYSSLPTAKILGTAMFGTVTSSIVTGFFIPYLFLRLKMDPANASGPIGTVIQDFMSVLIYFLVVTWLLL